MNPVVFPPGANEAFDETAPTGSATITNTSGTDRVSCWNAASDRRLMPESRPDCKLDQLISHIGRRARGVAIPIENRIRVLRPSSIPIAQSLHECRHRQLAIAHHLAIRPSARRSDVSDRPAAPAPPSAMPLPRHRATERTRGAVHSITSSARASSRGRAFKTAPLAALVEDQLEFGRLHHWQVSGLFALEDATRIDAGLTMRLRQAGAIAH